jgi:hypothetical protein
MLAPFTQTFLAQKAAEATTILKPGVPLPGSLVRGLSVAQQVVNVRETVGVHVFANLVCFAAQVGMRESLS